MQEREGCIAGVMSLGGDGIEWRIGVRKEHG